MKFGCTVLVLALAAATTSVLAQSPPATSPKPPGLQMPAGSQAQLKIGGPAGSPTPSGGGAVTVVTVKLAGELARRIGLTDVNTFSESDRGFVRGNYNGNIPVLLSLGACNGDTCGSSITYYAMFGKQEIDLTFANAYNVKYVAKMVIDTDGVYVMTNQFMDGGANFENLVGSAKVFLNAIDIALTFKP